MVKAWGAGWGQAPEGEAGSTWSRVPAKGRIRAGVGKPSEDLGTLGSL